MNDLWYYLIEIGGLLMKLKKVFRRKIRKTTQIVAITAIALSLLTLYNTKADEQPKLFTEDGYFTAQEIKDMNQMDTVTEMPKQQIIIPLAFDEDVPNVENASGLVGPMMNMTKPMLNRLSLSSIFFNEASTNQKKSEESQSLVSNENAETPPPTYLKRGVVYPNHTNAGGENKDYSIHIYDSSTSSNSISSVGNQVRITGVIPFINASEDRYHIVVSGVNGWVEKKFFNETAVAAMQAVNKYRVLSNNTLQFNVAYQAVCQGGCNYGSINNGPAPAYLKQGKDYVSFDGHYFYEYEKFEFMLLDYSKGVRSNSVNPTTPFYNYYQFLPMRAMSNYSGDTIESYLSRKGYTKYADTDQYPVVSNDGSMSKLKDQGKHFFNHGKRFNINPILTFGISVNETGWGRSAIAVQKNNMFGFNAFDSSPNDASLFKSVEQSIYEINTPTFNWGYMDPDPTFRTNYRGSYLGDNKNGFNVMYASDPYWGQKAASTYYEIDSLYGSLDFQKSTIGLTKTSGTVNVYMKPEVNGIYRYPRSNGTSVPFTYRNANTILVMETLKGETINGSDVWYKVQSDFMMTTDRTPTPTAPDGSHRKLPYLQDSSFYYMHSSDVTIINQGTGLIKNGNEPTTPTEPEKPTFASGDVNGDGRISAADYIIIKNHIMDVNKLTGDVLQRADVNKDGRVSAADYMIIKNIIMGR